MRRCTAIAAAAAIAFVAACSGSAAKRAAPTTTTTIATTAPAVTTTTTVRAACTEADLSKPVDRVPTLGKITHRRVIEPETTFLDPPGSVMPRISAAIAWHGVTKGRTGGGRGQLLLAYATSQGAKIDHRLVWFVEWHHLASRTLPPGGAAAPLGGVTGLTAPVTTTPPICVFGGEYEVVDATTGQELLGASGTEQILFAP